MARSALRWTRPPGSAASRSRRCHRSSTILSSCVRGLSRVPDRAWCRWRRSALRLRRGCRRGEDVRRPARTPCRRAALAGGRSTVDCGDVASNVAIRDRRDAAGQRATAPDASGRIGRLTSCPRGFRARPRSDTIARGWTPRDAVGRLRRFVVCMAWKRSGVRFPLAPRKTAGQRPVRAYWL